MPPVFVLVHSPLVGPSTWQPVAGELAARGHEVVVPSLLGTTDLAPPYTPRFVQRVAEAVAATAADAEVVLVLHSNAGRFAPVLATGIGRTVRACVFVDARLPASGDAMSTAEPEFVAWLREKAVNGRLPPWSQWWGEDADLSELYPDEATMRRLTAEEPRLPIDYYDEVVSAPQGWDAVPCAYIVFGEPYLEVADEARARGWPVVEVPGQHLHQVVDPAAVTDAITRLSTELAC